MLDTLEKQTNLRLLSAEDLAALTDVELQRDLPTGFIKEAQVIFRELKSDQGNATYDDIDEPTPVVNNGNYTTISNFVHNVAVNGYVRNWYDIAEATPLGIRVTYPSFIVLKIHDDTDWTFSDITAAIKLKEPVQYADRYGHLHYVRPDGTTSQTPIADCKIVFFAAMPVITVKPNSYIRQLNYYVRDGLGTEQIVDPDIRYPGNGNS